MDAVLLIGGALVAGCLLAVITHRPKKPPLPTCFGDQPPNPQHQAENCCHDCPIHTECWMLTMDRNQ